MKEYHKIVTFKYKNNYYNMYLDNENKHFFLRITDKNQLSYVTTEELLELTSIFTKIHDKMYIEYTPANKIVKLIPKVLKGGIAVALSTSLLTGCVSEYNEQVDSSNQIAETTNLEEATASSYISSAEEEIEIDGYYEGPFSNYVYDMEYIDEVFDEKTITLESLYEVIDENSSIPEKYKKLLKEYSYNVTNTYPNIELRVFYENLKTLEVVEQEKETINEGLNQSNIYGYYDQLNNQIHVVENMEYEKGSWPYQVIFHELSHCLRAGTYQVDGKLTIVGSDGFSFHNKITLEALNSLFAVSVLGYDESIIAYQLQSNYFKIMVDCMDNYDLSDYVNHSESYFAYSLDEYNGDNNYATTILELMQVQYDDLYSYEIEVEQEEYYPIYDYICNMYFNKYISNDLTYNEAKELTDNLVDNLLYGTPEEYNIDTTRFYENLDNYCNKIGINTNVKTL